MCGIAGVIDKTGRLSPASLATLAGAMADAMPYRGPDDRGVWADPAGGCALSHRRLSIIDTSAGGHQPRLSADERHVITYNGEFYGYRALKSQLEAAGVQFATLSDTEVLLEGLARRGAALFDGLDGMFALGLWDRHARRLTLARDPFGEKPVYYLDRPDLFAFASELHALARVPGFDPAITREALASYLCWQYVPAPATIYRGARKLPPGSTLTLDRDGAVKIERYFAFRADGPPAGTRPLDDLAEDLEAILTRTIETRLISDVPLGAFLSGGVDSTVVAALVTKKLGRRLDTFSIGFAGHAESEHHQARETAAHLGATHHEQVLEPDTVELGRRLGAALDEPNGDTSCLPTWLLSGFARERVTVALSGDGGDELFGGYNRYFDTLGEAEHAAPGGWTPGQAYLSDRILLGPEAVLAQLFGQVPAGLVRALAAERAFLDRDDRPLLHRMRELDARHYMPGAVLPKVDRMSMQHSLEVRAPLLGIEVAAFAGRLAAADCYAAGSGKRVLKRVAERYVPRAWLDRPKRGFGLPMDGWGKAALLPAATEMLLAPDARLTGWIARPALERFLASQAQSFSPYRVWALFVLETWLRTHPAVPAEEPALVEPAPRVFLARARRFFGMSA